MKICKKCLVEKPLVEFHNDRKRKDGRYPNCKVCHNHYIRERHKNPIVRAKHVARHNHLQKTSPKYRQRAVERANKFYNSIEGRAKTLLAGAKRRQKDSTVTLEHLIELLKIGRCPVTNIDFSYVDDYKIKTGRNYNPFSPSIDKIKPSLGYTNENVRLVIWQYNLMKGEITDQEILLICKAVVDNS